MKKPITIPNVDIELYEALKERCRQDGTSISTYFNSLLAGGQDESTKVAELSKQLQENNELLNKRANTITELAKTIQQQKNTIAEQQSKIIDIEEYEVSGKALLNKADELKQKLTAKDAELEEAKKALETLKNQIESLRKTSSDDGVFVELSPLELALINYVAESEQARHKDNSITPAGLLKAMFVNYTIHGDMYFFPHPSRSTLRDLKAKIEAQNQEKNEEKTHE